ncbi:hypothetical protein [Streptomyces roseolus]|uniref:hypothetical protein n=1 Tax=Streptomyces roseolus TaxID=67358 RepID=UPI0016760782|nr:hypothetical protein [Streptomyces roseolus]GGR67065.1 hypothetical protein GCM10010282_69990 [Streptomyces roseolus]
MKLSLPGRLPVAGLLAALCLIAAVPGAAATARPAPGTGDVRSGPPGLRPRPA